MTLRYGAATDRGRMREGNEDNLVSRTHLFAVADGMGGHQGGEVASRIAVDTLADLPDAGPWASAEQAKQMLRDCVVEANRKIREMAASDRGLEGMGTTLTAVLEDGYTVHLAHVGDSRAYLYSGGHLSLLTEDHTLVQQLVRENRLTPEEAEHHPQKSIITRALGVEDDLDPDLDTYQRRPGDRLLLCTDGLSGMVEDEDLRRVLQKVRDPQQAADELINLANDAGGHDNITVIVLDTQEAPSVQGDTSELTGLNVPGGPPPMGDTRPIPPGALDGPPMADDDFEPQRLAVQMDPTRGERMGHARAGPAPRRSRLMRRVIAAASVLALVAAAAFGAQSFVFSNYWVGYDNGEVVVFQGMPGDIAGLQLSRVVKRTQTTREQVPAFIRDRLDTGLHRESREEAVSWAHCVGFADNAEVLTDCVERSTGEVTTPPASVPTTVPDTTTAPASVPTTVPDTTTAPADAPPTTAPDPDAAAGP